MKFIYLSTSKKNYLQKLNGIEFWWLNKVAICDKHYI